MVGSWSNNINPILDGLLYWAVYMGYCIGAIPFCQIWNLASIYHYLPQEGVLGSVKNENSKGVHKKKFENKI